MATQKTISIIDFNIIIADLNNVYKEIDVREMEMPLPMITIVKELENLKEIGALLVNHYRIPHILLNDINDPTLTIYITQKTENHFQLLFQNL